MTPSMMPEPQTIERQNKVWWSKHAPDNPFQAQTPIEAAAVWPPVQEVDGKTVSQRVAPFIRCPLPVSGVQFWGFGSKADRDSFVALNAGLGAQSL